MNDTTKTMASNADVVKKYGTSAVMKRAWCTFKFMPRFKTFADALRFAWAGFRNQINEARQKAARFTRMSAEYKGALNVRSPLNPHMACLTTLRASRANDVFLLKRSGWVKDTIALFEAARTMPGGNHIAIRWLQATTLAQIPPRFDGTEIALGALEHIAANPDKMITDMGNLGFMREVYYQLARLHSGAEDLEKATHYLGLSGYKNFERPFAIVTPFAPDKVTGNKFTHKHIREIIPDRVFVLNGYEFTDFYFIVSNDGRELISIDAGTRPDSAQTAYESLRKFKPGLPQLTTIIFTHAHWDHIGGTKYFKSLNPNIQFIARDNYREELKLMALEKEPYFKYFFGTQYTNKNFENYKPDQLVSTRERISIGGSVFDLIPIAGGETVDGLFIHMPNLSVTFVGDFIMPYLGAPFLPEGNVSGLYSSIDLINQINPAHALHGHQVLTQLFKSAA